MSKRPPLLSKSLPFIGHALEFAKDRGELFERGLVEKGKAFTLRLGTKKGVVLIGPEYADQFFKETDGSLNMAKPYQFLRVLFGNVSFLADHPTYLKHKPTVNAPFSREKMLGYLPVMQKTVQRWLDSLPDEGAIELTSKITELVQDVAGFCLGGADFMEEVGAEFWKNYNTLGKALDPLLPPNLPLPKFIRRDKAKRRLTKILKPIIDKRRANPAGWDDVLQDIINTPFADGTIATDAQIQNLIMALMFAGHETTAGQASWTLIQLLQNPEYLTKVQSEIAEKFPYGAQIDARSLINLKTIRWAIDETTRMQPSADILIRVTDEPMEVGEYTIPEGWPVFIAVGVGQRMEEVFDNPEQYDPLRFSPERAEHKREKCAISGFGGGVHKCVGMNFALNEMLTITTLFFQQFEATLSTKVPVTVRDLGASRPGETWVNIKRKSLSKLVSPDVLQEGIAAGCPHLAHLAAKAKDS